MVAPCQRLGEDLVNAAPVRAWGAAPPHTPGERGDPQPWKHPMGPPGAALGLGLE